MEHIYWQAYHGNAPGFPDKLATALAYLETLIARGVEFPDAQWSASERHGVNPDTLADAYDEAHS